MTRYWIPLAISAALGLTPGTNAADLTRPARFGSLETASVESAQAQSAAWLKATGKADAAVTARELLALSAWRAAMSRSWGTFTAAA